ncbi:MAG TPA: TlyA family RNA methyltransferase [Aestuariivirgaceae bacterium]|nr:TlyA family RNA methyltransferase [Aestuariivirgaceae bacterium]
MSKVDEHGCRDTRLDIYLVERGFFRTRARARDAILRGTVEVDGVGVSKPSRQIAAGAAIVIRDEARTYVSRAALKLKHALDHFGIDVSGRLALDIGASTGGFTQLLLERGASRVIALDVGHGQLAPSLRDDPRVQLMEGLNARDLRAADLPENPNLIVCDVGFISLKLALPPALALARPGACLIALIKPQFEAGREAVAGSGIIRDAAIHRKICDDIACWLAVLPEWHVIGVVSSPIMGAEGNAEFLIAAEKHR